MQNFKNITIFSNRIRVDFLLKARENIIEYFRNIEHQELMNEPTENETARRKRTEINIIIERLHDVVSASNVSTTYILRTAPIAGGRVYTLDTIINIFQLNGHQIPPDATMDPIERSIGVYENDRINSIIRTFNPFWWAKRALDLFSTIPLMLLSLVGFNFHSLEKSFFGRTISGIFWILGALLLLLQLDETFGTGLTEFMQQNFPFSSTAQ